MKNFLKIFFICVCFFISLAANACNINHPNFNVFNQPSEISALETNPAEEFLISEECSENSIAAPNSQNHEIYTATLRKNTLTSGSTDRSATSQRLTQQIFISKYNKILYSSSHKISPYLKNELCTRAP